MREKQYNIDNFLMIRLNIISKSFPSLWSLCYNYNRDRFSNAWKIRGQLVQKQFCSPRSQYRARWIAAEERETRALYWPRSWPRRSAASPSQSTWWGTVSLHLRRGRALRRLFYRCSLFSTGRSVLCRFSSPLVFVGARNAGRAGGASYRRRIFAVVIQRWLSRETGEAAKGGEKERLDEKRVANREGKPTATTDRYIVSDLQR